MNKPHVRAGKKARMSDLVDIGVLLDAYYDKKPDVNLAAQAVIFGTSGHRGSANKNSFNENHILAIAQAIVDIRKKLKITGPCFIGKDTHLLSSPALKTLLEVFVANRIVAVIAENNGYTPTPVISHAIINYNRNRTDQSADGIVITPSHNQPEDGGIKYNSIYGEPADMNITKAIEMRANMLLKDDIRSVKRVPYSKAVHSGYIRTICYEKAYIDDLVNVIDMDVIAGAALNIGIDPLGGAGFTYWPIIAEKYKLNLNIVNDILDPTFGFMYLDHDGIIRMDCSSPFAMNGLIKLKDSFDLAFCNDTDFDRHGIVTPAGLMNANAYLATVTDYLLTHRPHWKRDIAIGKTLVTTAMLDKIATNKGHKCCEYPVGFKWYAEGLFHGKLGFACEESAGGSLLRHNGDVWTTDKDGIILCLLAAEMTAKTNRNPADRYKQLTEQFGCFHYGRIQTKASLAEKEKLAELDTNKLTTDIFAGEKIEQSLTKAPANNMPIGGLKVITENGWFAARPSGTEDAYKIYAESFISDAHLRQIQQEAQNLVSLVIK